MKSLLFLPILSREAINSSTVEKQNLSLLARSSNLDNVLLEYRLALEFAERGMLVGIYPVLVGDYVMDLNVGMYTDYFSSGCHPTCTNNIVVDSVENTVQDHLNRLCFGTPLLDNMTVPVILDAIVRNQGCLIDGPADTAFDTAIEDVIAIVKDKKRHEKGDAGTSSKHSRRGSYQEFMHQRGAASFSVQ